tara:strand:- start:600 stop:1151 length:552 start_codon:yes stop_codon:yes gene_type:complete
MEKNKKNIKEDDGNNYYLNLREIPVRNHFEQKGGLDYLNWAKAWDRLKLKHPESNYRVIRDKTNNYNYFTNDNSGWVVVKVTVNNISHIVDLAIMDNRNNSIPKENINSTDVVNTIMRALAKGCALHGLGLNAWTREKDYISDTEYNKLYQKKDKDLARKAIQTRELTIEQTQALTKLHTKNN